jgi:hypothetical protein
MDLNVNTSTFSDAEDGALTEMVSEIHVYLEAQES